MSDDLGTRLVDYALHARLSVTALLLPLLAGGVVLGVLVGIWPGSPSLAHSVLFCVVVAPLIWAIVWVGSGILGLAISTGSWFVRTVRARRFAHLVRVVLAWTGSLAVIVSGLVLGPGNEEVSLPTRPWWTALTLGMLAISIAAWPLLARVRRR